MNDYLAAVHRVSTTILSITTNDNPGPIHKCSEVVARSAKYLNFHWLIQVRADLPLPVYIMQLNFPSSVQDQFPEHGIELTMREADGI